MKDKKLPIDKQAKRDVLKSLSDDMRGEMHGKLKDDFEGLKKGPMKKVSVVAPDAESMEKGLDMAKKLAPKMEDIAKKVEDVIPEADQEDALDMDEAAEEHMEEEHEPSSEHASQEADELVESLSSEQDIDEVIKKLEEKKRSLKA